MQQEKWVRNIRAGDQAAFRQFYEAYAGPAIRTASAITRNREMAKDAVQETFIRVYRQIGNYNPTLPFDPWFYRILTNECLRLMKRESPLSNIETFENDPSLAEESFDQLRELYDIIQALDDSHRIPLILKYIKGFSEKEIADILGLNQNTVKSRLFKGRKRLKEQLEPTREEDMS
ncbi:RNA polymerase sigma factor [Sporosarcina sp. Marseille-Q4943]|uniref:RNA polymerase sigma factor n=1 Tax=Sporosarcina sp. Marseille-Q4943 TaxID=2942204 RepID=UPI00208DDBF0|nr:RNA polymerase sigma factor [Sporosarcina sp. Marseille-Q4943]